MILICVAGCAATDESHVIRCRQLAETDGGPPSVTADPGHCTVPEYRATALSPSGSCPS